MYDHTDQRFVSVCSERLTELWSDPPSDITVPPFHCASSSSSEGLTLTVYLNKKRPLSEPKWCRTDQADDWLLEQFGSRKGSSDAGWRGKLEIMDPDPVRLSNPALLRLTFPGSHTSIDSRLLDIIIHYRLAIRPSKLHQFPPFRPQ